jgi:hypothetical protein
MDLRLATLKAVSFYLLHNFSTLNQCRTFSCVTIVCKHLTSYQDYPNYKWDLIRSTYPSKATAYTWYERINGRSIFVKS